MSEVIVATTAGESQAAEGQWRPAIGWPVPVVMWPEEADRSEELARDGRIRLFLVAPGVAPPIDWDGRTDWIRRPAAAGDIYARIEALQRRAEHAEPPGRVELDDTGVLRVDDRWVVLTPIETRLMRALLDKTGAVVSRGELLNAGWPGKSSRALDTNLQRLRGRIAHLGLRLVNVRRRGYILAPDAA
ncbi:MAG TPA: winged helix-turn-helix domain-containing protein [Acidimicrobiia bacterium]|nr:winged helix-turn-helix domain-containing protein [Acidimicrobiia bacterium]